jgi:hypothetical protein
MACTKVMKRMFPLFFGFRRRWHTLCWYLNASGLGVGSSETVAVGQLALNKGITIDGKIISFFTNSGGRRLRCGKVRALGVA